MAREDARIEGCEFAPQVGQDRSAPPQAADIQPPVGLVERQKDRPRVRRFVPALGEPMMSRDGGEREARMLVCVGKTSAVRGVALTGSACVADRILTALRVIDY